MFMDKDVLESITGEIQSLPCVFEKTVLAVRCQCSLAQKIFVAEREGLQCTVAQAHERCDKIVALVRDKTSFTFGLPSAEQALPHRKRMRLQAGLLSALALDLYGDETIAHLDINALLAAAMQHYQNIENFPVTQIMRTIAN